METKANYVLIGLFTLGGILGALGLLLWFAKVEVDRQYAYYDILFADVSGLGAASDVRYNGLPVGQVVDLELDEVDSSQVRVRIEVSADTPVNADTVAKLQSQGVTGVSFVGLSGGSETSVALSSGSEIPSERTALQSVFEGAPVLLDRAVVLLENVNDVFDRQNREAVSTTLDNLASASARIDAVLNDFESLSGDLGSAAREIAQFTDRLDALADTAETTLTTATGALETADGTVATIGEFTTTNLVPLANELRTATETANRVIGDVGTQAAQIAGQIDTLATRGAVVLDNANQTFTTANTAIESINSFTTTNLVPLSDDLRTTTQTANRVITETGGEVQRIAGRIDQLADRGTVALDSAVVAMDDAQNTIRDARTTVARANTYIDQQLTPLTEDLRTTTQTANRVIDDVGARAAVVADRFITFADDGTALIATADQTFTNADVTLAAVFTAMEDATVTLASANKTFELANQIIENDIGGIIADLRGAATAFTSAVTVASEGIDTVTDEVLAASRSAANLTASLEKVVRDNERQLSDFVRLGLPAALKFTDEARSLVVNMERLVNKIERDPARFLLGTQNSRFNR